MDWFFGIGWLIGKSCATKPFPEWWYGGYGYTDRALMPASGCLESMRCRCFLGSGWVTSTRFTVTGDPPTPAPTRTLTPTPTLSPTITSTPTPTGTATPRPTLTPSRTPTITPTRMVTNTPRPTHTRMPTATEPNHND